MKARRHPRAVPGHDVAEPETVASAIRIGAPASKEGALAPAYEDEILKAALVVRDGAIVHPALKT